jgi:hypothetical protein
LLIRYHHGEKRVWSVVHGDRLRVSIF